MYKIISLNQSSWEQAIKNRFKNLRRGKRPSNNETCKPGTSSQSKWIKKKDQPTSNSSGETDETVKEHCSTMKKELSKTSNKNLVLVRELMNATFEARRIQIMNNPTTIEATLKIYPALKLVSEVHVILLCILLQSTIQCKHMGCCLTRRRLMFLLHRFSQVSQHLTCLDHTIQTQKTIWYPLNNTIPQNPGTSCLKLRQLIQWIIPSSQFIFYPFNSYLRKNSMGTRC